MGLKEAKDGVAQGDRMNSAMDWPSNEGSGWVCELASPAVVCVVQPHPPVSEPEATSLLQPRARQRKPGVPAVAV